MGYNTEFDGEFALSKSLDEKRGSGCWRRTSCSGDGSCFRYWEIWRWGD